jgi:tetratricopeptide (TPR) repeat protein
MDNIQPQGGSLALEPMDAPTAGGQKASPTDGGPIASPADRRELRMASADEFLAAATKEYEEGHIEPTLWARASAQSGNDELLVIAAYLRARATELRLQKRDARRERRASRAHSRRDTRNRENPSGVRPEITPATAAGVRIRGLQLTSKSVAVAAAALVSVVAAIWWIVSPQGSGSSGARTVSVVAPPSKGSAPAGPLARAKPVVGSTSGGRSESDSVARLEATVQQLKDTGNWNVLVLYASKWTRDEPNNATAWNELSTGYANLRQFNDALIAATKAVALSPGDASLWRNVGHLNMTLENLPEAGSAFDRALAISSDDTDALCGAATVAKRLGRTKDAEAIAKRITSAESSCPTLSEGESVAVVVRAAPATKPASSARR